MFEQRSKWWVKDKLAKGRRREACSRWKEQHRQRSWGGWQNWKKTRCLKCSEGLGECLMQDAAWVSRASSAWSQGQRKSWCSQTAELTAERAAGVGAYGLIAPLLVLNQDKLASIKGIKIRSKLKPVSGQFLGLPTDGNVTLGNSSSLPENQTHPTLRPF